MDILSRAYNKLLPHISRIFTASAFRFVLLASFLSFFVLNIWMWLIFPMNLCLERLNVLSSPFSLEYHIVLGKQLYAQGNQVEARKELVLAQDIPITHTLFAFFTPYVLGAQSEPSDILHAWDKQQTYTIRAYQFWKIIVAQKPDFRDAYITLATLCFTLQKHDEGVTYLQKAYSIDPNNAAIKVLAVQFGVVL